MAQQGNADLCLQSDGEHPMPVLTRFTAQAQPSHPMTRGRRRAAVSSRRAQQAFSIFCTAPRRTNRPRARPLWRRTNTQKNTKKICAQGQRWNHCGCHPVNITNRRKYCRRPSLENRCGEKRAAFPEFQLRARPQLARIFWGMLKRNQCKDESYRTTSFSVLRYSLPR